MTNPTEFIEAIIQSANVQLIEVNLILNDMTSMDAEWNAYIQVKKDLRSFISDQEWTLSLVQDGGI